jgi:folate-dependent phosphoribosylglycinamide formyltransferase PurN
MGALSPVEKALRTLLICHEEDPIDREGLARWLASFSTLAGLVVIRERKSRSWKRIRREVRRVGAVRFLDVLAFRLHYRLTRATADARWKGDALAALCARYPEVPAGTPVHTTHSPNAADTEAFIRSVAPDIMLARCKVILKKSVFSIPAKGTWVLHPGICPEYRNAHGCFWALANDDLDRVGVTLLRIDEGVDTGPIYGYFTYPYDERQESHVVIQYRALLDNLDAVAARFAEIQAGEAKPIDTRGRASGEWGQPWLSRQLRWQRRARRRNAETSA